MPRGDAKKPGEPRKSRKVTDTPQYIPPGLARRQRAFDEQKDQHGETRPGSQQDRGRK